MVLNSSRGWCNDRHKHFFVLVTCEVALRCDGSFVGPAVLKVVVVVCCWSRKGNTRSVLHVAKIPIGNDMSKGITTRGLYGRRMDNTPQPATRRVEARNNRKVGSGLGRTRGRRKCDCLPSFSFSLSLSVKIDGSLSPCVINVHYNGIKAFIQSRQRINKNPNTQTQT